MEAAQKLFDYIDASPTCYHAVKNVEDRLLQAGFEKLSEKEAEIIAQAGKFGAVTMATNMAMKAPSIGIINSTTLISASLPIKSDKPSGPSSINMTPATANPPMTIPNKKDTKNFTIFFIISILSPSPRWAVVPLYYKDKRLRTQLSLSIKFRSFCRDSSGMAA